jgi:glutamine amidotransferase
MFMHNGFIGSWSRLRRQVEGFIPDELYPARIGTTDSEAVFLAILGASMDDPVAAAESVLARLTALVNETSPPDRLRFTAALSNGRDLYAFRYAVNDRANTLYYRESDAGIVIVSEPLDRDHKNWIAVPENSVVVACAGERARIVPLFHRHQEAAE